MVIPVHILSAAIILEIDAAPIGSFQDGRRSESLRYVMREPASAKPDAGDIESQSGPLLDIAATGEGERSTGYTLPELKQMSWSSILLYVARSFCSQLS